MKQPLFFKNKYVGDLDLVNKAYISFRNQSHYFYKFKGFGISESILDILVKNKIETIIINFENNKVYHTSIDRFLIFGEEYNDNEDKQLILTLDKFMIYPTTELQQTFK